MRLPVCGCGRVMECTKTGLSTLTHTEDGAEYQLFSGDEFTCPSCRARVVLLATEPISEYWKPGFAAAKRAGERPGSRQFKAYYRAVPDAHLHPNIAGVDLKPLREDALVEACAAIGKVSTEQIQNLTGESSVDSTTDEVQTPSTTEAPSSDETPRA